MLEFTPGPLIEQHFAARQAADGTVFWLKTRDESSIHVLHNDQKVSAAKSWSGDIRDWDCFGNALFFLTADRKIYKTTFHEPAEIRVEFVRELEEDEKHEERMMASRPKDGGRFAYRLCDDPKGGIRINMEYATIYDDYEDDDLEDLRLEAIYRNKLIYARESGGVTWARELTQSIIAIDAEEGPNAYDGYRTSVYAPAEASLIYLLTDHCELTVVHPITLEERSFGLSVPSSSERLEMFSFVGVHRGKIMLRGRCGSETRIFTADFSEELRQFEQDAADFAEEIKTDEDD